MAGGVAPQPITERRIGVYVCHCGGNISDYVDVKRVVEAVKDEPGVVVARDTIFACADATQQDMDRTSSGSSSTVSSSLPARPSSTP